MKRSETAVAIVLIRLEVSNSGGEPADGLNTYMVYDAAELDLHDLFLARVQCHGERWRLRFLVLSPVQLRGKIARLYQTRRPAGQSPLPITDDRYRRSDATGDY